MYSADMEKKSLQVWLPADLHERLQSIAEKQRRSKGAQVAYMLEHALDDLDATNAQVKTSATDEERQKAMERIR